VGSANISLDLNLEFLNRIVKEAIKKLGPNGSKKSIDRICRSMKTTKALMENFDAEVKSYKPSGKHVPKSSAKDLQTIVKELLHQQYLGGLIAFMGGGGLNLAC
jgi:shikimate kinase